MFIHPSPSETRFDSSAEQREFVARALEEIARALDAEHGNRYRVRAYRRAAAMIRDLRVPVTEWLRGKTSGVGSSLRATIHELVEHGRLPESKGLTPAPMRKPR
ncbi:MAG TPA: helix-hairpin-helix domain-containing protein [Pirellulales bacterium]|nr:helix-hairpin-helix domain-containing protein [Pirellulales bacterium]